MKLERPDRIADRFLFQPAPAWQLGALRLAFFGWLFLWYLLRDYTFVATYPAVFWTPIDLFRALGHAAQPPEALIIVLQIVWKLALLTAALGLFTRVSVVVALVLSAYILGLSHSFHKINHSDAALVLAMLVFAFTRCADAVSIDALRKAARNPTRDTRPAPSPAYHWPVRALWILWVIVFVLSGISKLRNGGFGWMLSDNLSNIIVRNQTAWEPMLPFGIQLAEQGWLCKLFAVGTVVFELFAFLVLFSKWFRLLIVPALLSMQVGILLVMSDNFTQFFALYLAFVPFALLPMLRPWLASRVQPIEVLYDGMCGLCGRTVAILRRLDLLGVLRFRDAVGEWTSIEADHPSLTQSACLADMHAITPGREPAIGFDAYRRIAWSLPAAWIILPLLYAPGVRAVGTRVYRHVAARRARAGCALPTA